MCCLLLLCACHEGAFERLAAPGSESSTAFLRRRNRLPVRCLELRYCAELLSCVFGFCSRCLYQKQLCPGRQLHQRIVPFLRLLRALLAHGPAALKSTALPRMRGGTVWAGTLNQKGGIC